MKNLIRQMVVQLTASGAASSMPLPDARLAVQRAAVEDGALVDVRHG